MCLWAGSLPGMLRHWTGSSIHFIALKAFPASACPRHTSPDMKKSAQAPLLFAPSHLLPLVECGIRQLRRAAAPFTFAEILA